MCSQETLKIEILHTVPGTQQCFQIKNSNKNWQIKSYSLNIEVCMFLSLDFKERPQVLWWLPCHLKSAFFTERFPITSQIIKWE